MQREEAASPRVETYEEESKVENPKGKRGKGKKCKGMNKAKRSNDTGKGK